MPSTRPEAMLAAVVEKFNEEYTIKDIPVPRDPRDHEILVKVLAASYCHTDAVFCSGSLSQELPRVGCHEFAGEVVSLGPQVSSDLRLEIGTKVGVPGRAYNPCGECFECKITSLDPKGYSPYCVKAKNLGLTADGGFQEYCLVDSRQVAPIPSSLTAIETAPLMCAGLTVWAALQRPEVKDTKSVAIMGAAGGLGHLGIQFAARLQKQVVAVDVGKKAMILLDEVVKELGDCGKLVSTVDALEVEAQTLIQNLQANLTPGEQGGVDAVIVLPDSQAAMTYGLSLLKHHGTAVVVSFPDKDFQISGKDLVFRDIRIVGSLVGRNYQLREMLSFAAEHNVRAKLKTFRLKDLNELVKEYHKAEGGKLLVDMTLK